MRETLGKSLRTLRFLQHSRFRRPGKRHPTLKRLSEATLFARVAFAILVSSSLTAPTTKQLSKLRVSIFDVNSFCPSMLRPGQLYTVGGAEASNSKLPSRECDNRDIQSVFSGAEQAADVFESGLA
ncbi:hypothetical protein BS17DRAFT_791182 [Gyrodon lividus]|nr:hypothetical protein BS17DRAFT_791182 [Gyrodon lividus]